QIAATCGVPAAISEVARLVTTPRQVMEGREHFGFMDGLSQPILEGTHDAEDLPDSIHLTALGEVLLGYPNGAGLIPRVPSLPGSPSFGRNGSYLVMRELDQDVGTFKTF